MYVWWGGGGGGGGGGGCFTINITVHTCHVRHDCSCDAYILCIRIACRVYFTIVIILKRGGGVTKYIVGGRYLHTYVVS